MQRVQKIISNAGYCSRRKAEFLIEEGKVKVNGKTITIGDKAEETDNITINNKPLNKEKKIYLLLNKPVGYVCSLSPTSDIKPVTSLIKIKERIYPVGRLDVMTSGLLILTNDGDFANKVTHPRYEVKKTYRVELSHPLTFEARKRLSKGITLREGKTRPALVIIHNQESTEISITIHEGRNRIVRRMLQYLGYGVKTIHRTAVGAISLSSLSSGKYRELTETEIKSLTL